MVHTETPVSLAALSKLDGTEKAYENGQKAKLLQGKQNYSGLDLETESRPPVEAELFS